MGNKDKRVKINRTIASDCAAMLQMLADHDKLPESRELDQLIIEAHRKKFGDSTLVVKMSELNPTDAGAAAFQAGKALADNPFNEETDTERHFDWRFGFEAARDVDGVTVAK